MIDEEKQHETVQNSVSDSEGSVSAAEAGSSEEAFAGTPAIDPTLAATTIDASVAVPSAETVSAAVVDAQH